MTAARDESVRSHLRGLKSEVVTVNHRALMDKMLTRYPKKWTVFRELIGNAADASAKRVTIRILTSPIAIFGSGHPSPPSLNYVRQHNTVRDVVVHNDGRLFGTDDWNRLTSIAEGNPNIGSIGMFGVGFYSVFELSDEPIVHSGGEALVFGWKGKTLYSKRATLPPHEHTKDTRVILRYKDTATKVPDLVELGQFLAATLTFVDLSRIELWLDEWNVLSLSKKRNGLSIARIVDIKTGTEHMKIRKVEQETIQMDAFWLDAIYGEAGEPSPAPAMIPAGSAVTRLDGHSHVAHKRLKRPWAWLRTAPSEKAAKSPVTPLGETPLIEQDSSVDQDWPNAEELTPRVPNATIFLYITTAAVSTQIPGKLASGIEAVTKKKLPVLTSVSVLASCRNQPEPCPIFKYVLPSTSEPGRIFIGFSTLQTTGFQAHIRMSSIPTVDREHIDLSTKHVKIWNEELLQVAGIVGRVAWAEEMEAIKNRGPTAEGWKSGRRDEQMAEARRVFTQFNFQTSTPIPTVGRIIKEHFWKAGDYVEIISTQGVLRSTDVRLENKYVAGFVDSFPVFPTSFAERYKNFVRELETRGLISDIRIEDIRNELLSKILNGKQLWALLNWASLQNIESIEAIKSVINSATVEVLERRIITLKHVVYFADYGVPNELLPPNVIPFTYFQEYMSPSRFRKIGWQPLPVVEWVRHLANLSASKQFTGGEHEVLVVISSQWSKLGKEGQVEVSKMVKDLPIISTNIGMKTPRESYFRLVTPFRGLPYVKEIPGVSESFLEELGVRTVVGMNVIVEHLQSADDQPEILNACVSYLVEVCQSLSKEDSEKLRTASIWHAQDQSRDGGHRSAAKYRLNELFEPSDQLRELKLPMLYMPQRYRQQGPEGEFFRLLGLKTHPSVPELINIVTTAISSHDFGLRDRGLSYFARHFDDNNYEAYNYASVTDKFLPLEGCPDGHAAPNDCFTNEKAAPLGFPILVKDLHDKATKFGVKANPPLSLCVDRLVEKPPRTMQDAEDIFVYFSSFSLTDLGPHLDRLRASAIVPTFSKLAAKGTASDPERKDKNLYHVTPPTCFIGALSSDVGELADLFVCAHFSSEAAQFLAKCDAPNTPTADNIAEKFLADPERALEVVKSPEAYNKWFVWLGDQYKKKEIRSELMAVMSTKAFLLTTGYDAGVDGMVTRWSMPLKAVVVDDIHLLKLFREYLNVVPRNDAAESFCLLLGCQRLSAIVKESYTASPPVNAQEVDGLRTKILERSKIFLHDIDSARVKVGWEELREGLQVELAEHIDLCLELAGVKRQEQTKAVAMKANTIYKVCIVTSEDMPHSLSRALAKLLLQDPKPVDSLLFESIFQSELDALQERGYDIDRILGLHREITGEPLPQPRIEEPPRRRSTGRLSPAEESVAASHRIELSEKLTLPEKTLCQKNLNASITDNYYTNAKLQMSDGVDLGDYRSPRRPRSARNNFTEMKNGVLSLSSPSTSFPSKNKKEIEFIGELYVSKLLERVLGCEYSPNDHWTSSLRTRAGHKAYHPQSNDNSTFIIQDRKRRLTDFLSEKGYKNVGHLGDSPTFHIEVYASVYDITSPFTLERGPAERARKFTMVGMTLSSVQELFIVARVCNIYSDPKVVLYADPWQIHADGLLTLETNFGFWASFKDKAPAIFATEPTHSDDANGVEGRYMYQQLEPSTEIRLLKLYPGEDESPLEGEIYHVPIDSPGKFWALSYAWGAPLSTLSPYYIETPNGKVLITASLDLVLKSMRARGVAVRIWADAVCIDQRNALEKSLQIRRMGEIYQYAERVVAWLGTEEDNSHQAMETLAQIGMNRRATGVRPPYSILTEILHLWPASRVPDPSDSIWGDINMLLKRSWFTRAWIVQELVCGSDVFILCGKSEIRWEVFFGALVVCEEELNKASRSSPGDTLVLPNAGPAYALGETRRKLKQERRKCTMLELLELFAYTKATLEQDKIFALRGLAYDVNDAAFNPDYDSSVKVVLRQYAAGFVRKGHAMDLLYRAGTAKSYPFCSWIPSWTKGTFPQTISDWDGKSFYAGRKTLAEARLRYDDSDVLEVKGFPVDCIVRETGIRMGTTNFITFVDAMADIQRLIKSLGDSGYPTEETPHELMLWIPIGNAKRPYLEDHSTYYRSFAKTKEENWPPDLGHLLSISLDQDAAKYYEKPLRIRQTISKYWQTAAVFANRISGAKLCVTGRGYTGLIPQNAMAGDEICLFHGGKVPFVVRKTESGHRLIGECYIHGIMYGEALSFQDIQERIFALI